jgi:WAS family protein 1
MQSSFEVALVAHNHPKDITLDDVLHSLKVLQNTFDVTIAKISTRVSQERARITQVNTRVDVCYSKVQLIRGSNRATTVFSTAKFPAPKSFPYLSQIFGIQGDIPNPYPEPNDSTTYTLIGGRVNPGMSAMPMTAEVVSEVEHVYKRLNVHNTDMEKVEFLMEDKGLGQFPSTNNIPSVGSLLLYNTDINPYKNYVASDNLVSTGKTRAVDDASKTQLASAPTTLQSGDVLPDIEALDLTYKPQV